MLVQLKIRAQPCWTPDGHCQNKPPCLISI